jgi:hypothetical protein
LRCCTKVRSEQDGEPAAGHCQRSSHLTGVQFSPQSAHLLSEGLPMRAFADAARGGRPSTLVNTLPPVCWLLCGEETANSIFDAGFPVHVIMQWPLTHTSVLSEERNRPQVTDSGPITLA